MATLDDTDLKAIKNLMEVTIDEKVEDGTLASGDAISHLLTKDEFYEKSGEIISRLDSLEVEKDILSHQLTNRSDRLEKLEKIHPDYQHAS